MWFFGLIVVLLIGAVAVVASGRWGAMSTAYDDRPDMTVPRGHQLTSKDIESVRFGVGLRGYRMDEVDTFLARLLKEVADRDRRIADLERAVAPIVEAPDGAGFSSRPQYDPGDFDDTGTQAPILVGGDFPKVDPPKVEPPKPATEPEPEPAAKDETGGEAEREPDTAEAPAVQAAADEYERLQAEARRLLEAQSQPGAPRRTPNKPTQPVAQPDQARPAAPASRPDTDAAPAEESSEDPAGEDAYPRRK